MGSIEARISELNQKNTRIVSAKEGTLYGTRVHENSSIRRCFTRRKINGGRMELVHHISPRSSQAAQNY